MRVPAPTRRRRPLLFALIAALAIAIPTGVFAARPGNSVTIQLLNVSDWHGQLDTTAWSISAHWQEDRQAYPSLTLTAGDDYGATPALSGFFNEEPAILAERMMGIQVGALGNHNFDRGIAHLQQMIDLAGAPTDATHPGNPFTYVAANLKNIGANVTGTDAFRMFNVGGVKVAVIGISNEEGPTLVSPGAYGTIEVTDGVAAANRWAATARTAGANVVVVITHKGVRGFDTSANPFGELIDFTSALDPSLVDVVLGDHTDVKYNGFINGILVHENKSKGATYAKTLITATTGKGGRVTSKSATIVDPVPTPARTGAQLLAAECPNPLDPSPAKYCDPAILQMLVPYRQALSAQLDVKIGVAAATFPRGGNVERRAENALGDLIAEGMKWYQGTDFALMNSGGIRSSLISSYVPVSGGFTRTYPNADIVLGDVYTILPFTNTILKRSITGHQLWAALENGVKAIDSSGNGTDGRFPQIAGFKFSFDFALPTGCTGSGSSYHCVPSRVFSVTWPNGTPIPDDSTTYTIAIPNFVNQGGDSYLVFADGNAGTNELLDAQVFTNYFEYLAGQQSLTYPVVSPTIDGRITKCSFCAPA